MAAALLNFEATHGTVRGWGWWPPPGVQNKKLPGHPICVSLRESNFLPSAVLRGIPAHRVTYLLGKVHWIHLFPYQQPQDQRRKQMCITAPHRETHQASARLEEMILRLQSWGTRVSQGGGNPSGSSSISSGAAFNTDLCLKRLQSRSDLCSTLHKVWSRAQLAAAMLTMCVCVCMFVCVCVCGAAGGTPKIRQRGAAGCPPLQVASALQEKV